VRSTQPQRARMIRKTGSGAVGITPIGSNILSAAPPWRGSHTSRAPRTSATTAAAIPGGRQASRSRWRVGIVFVCDSFDAMVSRRPFGEAKGELEALGELRRSAGTQFDPHVVEAFLIEHAARRTGGKREGRHATAA
jgi:hypothetical protein